MKNYYQILGVNRHSDIQEIRSNYRKLAAKFHPDKNNGDAFFEEMFKEILEAYEVLSDNSKKIKYDDLYDNTFINKNLQTNVNHKEGNTNYEEKSKNQYSDNKNNIKKNKKKNYNHVFIGLIIIGILKLAFWIKDETYKKKVYQQKS